MELYEQEIVVENPDVRFEVDGQEAVTDDGAVTLTLTGPDRPERLLRVTDPLPEGAVNETEEAEIPKSMRVTERMTEWLSEPLVAENVTL